MCGVKFPPFFLDKLKLVYVIYTTIVVSVIIQPVNEQQEVLVVVVTQRQIVFITKIHGKVFTVAVYQFFLPKTILCPLFCTTVDHGHPPAPICIVSELCYIGLKLLNVHYSSSEIVVSLCLLTISSTNSRAAVSVSQGM